MCGGRAPTDEIEAIGGDASDAEDAATPTGFPQSMQ